MLDGDRLHVSDWARERAREIVLRPPVPWPARPLLETANFITIALLPDQIRRQYGFSPLPPAIVRKALVARRRRVRPARRPAGAAESPETAPGVSELDDFFASDWTPAGLVRFHASEKITLLAHDPEAANRLGRLVARQHELERGELERRYRELYVAALARPSSPGKRANALMHLAGHLKDKLGPADRRALRDAIEGHRRDLVPLEAPRELLRRHLREAGNDWARAQAYLRPGP